MAESDDKIAELQTRLENLVRTQIGFQQEITQIRAELNVLRGLAQKSASTDAADQTPAREYVPPPRNTPETRQTNPQTNPQTEQTTQQNPKPPVTPPVFGNANQRKSPFENAPRTAPTYAKSEIEKFIGENLISKIGIVILIIGVAIGAKYAIDKNIITPFARIVLGYIFGFGLLGLAVRLKEKYLNFSAVLLSGAMAILYFITFFGYSLYALYSQTTAFVLMAFFTVFTVVAALNYNRQIIAHLGLVGAYAVPFLLSDNSGKYAFFFTYIAIINTGILAISLKKYWKPLFYTSFVFTWAIFYAWYLSSYRADAHFALAWTFLSLFFLIFYLTFIGYKVVRDENIALENVALVLSNSFIFYGIGFSMLDQRAGFEGYLGLFTIGNAAIHMAFAYTISRLKLFPEDLVYLLTALVLTFATIAVPVQLDGNSVTLLWTAEAVILFWIGRRKAIALFQYFSFPLMLLATVSLLRDWVEFANLRDSLTAGFNFYPLMNGNFVTSLIFAAAFGFIFYVNRDERFEVVPDEDLRASLGYLFAAVGLVVLYNTFRTEIVNYYQYRSVMTAIPQIVNGSAGSITNSDLEYLSGVWQFNYTMLFLSVLSLLNIKRFKSFALAYGNLLLNFIAVCGFLAAGLYFLSELRVSYLRFDEPQYFAPHVYNILIRYISYAFFAALVYATFLYTKEDFLREKFDEYSLDFAFDALFYAALLIIASSELLNLMDIFGYQDSYKLGLSILWGIYALALIVLGINRHKRHLRIGAITLFALTLGKVFFYDIADLDTISKTVVFVSLGILMLIVSFLYNKYKAFIFETGENQGL